MTARGLAWMSGLRARSTQLARSAHLPGPWTQRGLILRGQLWPGGNSAVIPDAVVVLDRRGRIDVMGPCGQVPTDPRLPVLGSPESWIGPGIVDTQVTIAPNAPDDLGAGGVLAVRDLDASPDAAARMRRLAQRSGIPIAHGRTLATQPRSSDEPAALAISDRAQARAVIDEWALENIDAIHIVIESAAHIPGVDPRLLTALVGHAHDRGLPVVASAYSATMVARALDANVDELTALPAEPLEPELIERIGERRMVIGSRLQRSFADGVGAIPARNAAELVAAGARLVYATGQSSAHPGLRVDPRELDRLATAGLGRIGALRAATVRARYAAGFGSHTARLSTGSPAMLVLLPEDPIREPAAWHRPEAVIVRGKLIHRGAQ